MLVAILGVVCAVGVAGPSPARAQTAELDEPGTYLIEVSGGRVFQLGMGTLVAWSPDGRTVAVAEMGVEAPLPLLHLVRLPDGDGDAEVRDVSVTEAGDVNHLRWSPDGLSVAFTLTRPGRDPGPALMVVDVGTGDVRRLVRGNVGEITWTPDSLGITAITLDDAGGSIVTFDPTNGEVRETVPAARDAICQRGLAWSPDGAFLAFAGPGLREGCGDVGNWGVWTWEPKTQTLRHRFAGAADVPQWLASGEVVAMVSEPHADGIPPLSIMRISPADGPPRTLAFDVPRMFPQPPKLVQVVGETVLFPVSTCDRGQAHLWSPGRIESSQQTPDDVYAYRPALSPDSRMVAYVRIGDTIELVAAPVRPGPSRTLATTPLGMQVGTAGPWDAGGDWSPDGKWIAVEVTTEQFRDCVP